MAVDFTPTLQEYSGQGKFRYWVQMVLPTIYDDSLSYMELLNKVVYVINLAVEDIDNVEDNVAALLTAFQDLQQYTNDYFDNLDVQEEINAKLDELAEDGTLSTLILPLMPDIITAWLNEHVEPTSPIVDNSLSISGAAADSKTVGDKAFLYRLNTVITDNDLNSAIENGYYLLSTSIQYLNEPSELPSNAVKMLKVYRQVGGTYVLQELNINGGDTVGKTYRRFLSGATPTWKPWFLVTQPNAYYNTNYNVYPEADLNGDLNNGNTKTGFYILQSNYNYLNLPSDLVDVLGGKILEVYKNTTSFYTVQHLHVTSDSMQGAVYERRYSGATPTWSAWVQINKPTSYYDYIETKFNDNTIFSYDVQNFEITNNVKGDVLKVGCYNVANYNKDTATYIDTLNEKMFNFKNFINQADLDILAVQEDKANIDSAGTINAVTALYKPFLSKNNGSGGVTLHSRFSPNYSDALLHTSNDRQFRYGFYNVGDNKKLLVLSVHPVAGSTAELIAKRLVQYENIFKWVMGEITLESYNTHTQISVPAFTHAIIMGDFNSITQEDKQQLATLVTNNNMIMYNGGPMGWLETCRNASGSTRYALDNIITTNNVSLSEFTAHKSWYDKLYSDHYPVTAKIVLT